MFVDGERAAYEKVNTAFLGLKMDKGHISRAGRSSWENLKRTGLDTWCAGAFCDFS